MNRRRVLLAGLVLVVGVSFAAWYGEAPHAVATGSLFSAGSAAANTLPDRLTDRDFWNLSETFSEPGGTFHSDNFVSNEGRFETVIPDLAARAKQNGLYIGVGPEQNFTYMSVLRPKMAFIIDIRRGNLHEHLLYKALMEMSADRAEFLSRLFSRPRPAALTSSSSVETLFAAYDAVRSTEELYSQELTRRRRLADEEARPAVVARGPRRHRLRVPHGVFRRRPGAGLSAHGSGPQRPASNLRRAHVDAGPHRPSAQLSRVGRQFRVPEGSRIAEPGGTGRRETSAARRRCARSRSTRATTARSSRRSISRTSSSTSSRTASRRRSAPPWRRCRWTRRVQFIRSRVNGRGLGGPIRSIINGGSGGTGMFWSGLGDMRAESSACASGRGAGHLMVN